jgi:hypothetical protein
MKMDRLNKSLGHRPNKRELEKKNVHHSHSRRMSHRNIAAASALERCLKKDAIHLNLRNRPSKGQLYRSGVLNREHRKIAPSVAHIAKKMEHNMKKVQLNRKFKTKLDKSHLVNEGKIHSSNLGHTLQAPAKKLEMAFKRDALNRHLQLRPRTSELERRKILNPDHHRSKIDTSLVPKIGKLEKAFKKDALNRHLSTRPTVQHLHKKHILNVRNVSFGEARTMEQKLDDHLQKKLKSGNVHAPKHVAQSHFVHEKVDPKLHSLGHKLERQMAADHLSRSMKSRPSVREMKKRGVLKPEHGKIDGTMHQKKRNLEKAFLSDRLSRHLAHREQLQEYVHENLQKVPDFLDEEYESALPPRKEDEPMGLEYALDEVRHCLHDIGRFKMWLDYN